MKIPNNNRLFNQLRVEVDGVDLTHLCMACDPQRPWASIAVVDEAGAFVFSGDHVDTVEHEGAGVVIELSDVAPISARRAFAEAVATVEPPADEVDP